MHTNIVVLLVAFALNGGAWIRQHVVDRQSKVLGLSYSGQVLTCKDVYGRAFPTDSVREGQLMNAIGCGNGRDTMAVARVDRPGATVLLDSLVAAQAGAARSDATHRPPR